MAAGLRWVSTVIDTTQVFEAAEFYRQLLGWSYPEGREPQSDEVELDWLMLRGPGGVGQLSFQLVDELAPSTWPQPTVPQQLHLDFAVANTAALETFRARVIELGGRVVFDRSDDAEEPLYVFADLDGHPFCIFVG